MGISKNTEVPEADGVVAAHGALELEREDQVQIAARASRKGGSALGRRQPGSAGELGDVVLAQEPVGFGGYVSMLELMKTSLLPARRTFPLLFPPDISFASDTAGFSALTNL